MAAIVDSTLTMKDQLLQKIYDQVLVGDKKVYQEKINLKARIAGKDFTLLKIDASLELQSLSVSTASKITQLVVQTQFKFPPLADVKDANAKVTVNVNVSLNENSRTLEVKPETAAYQMKALFLGDVFIQMVIPLKLSLLKFELPTVTEKFTLSFTKVFSTSKSVSITTTDGGPKYGDKEITFDLNNTVSN